MNKQSWSDVLDCIIIGGGPAGCTAAIYLTRAGLKVKIFEKDIIGGKITQSGGVKNIPGFKEISGIDFGEHLQEQLDELNIPVVFDEVTHIEYDKDALTFNPIVEITYHNEKKTEYAKTVLLATGTENRHLNIPGEDYLVGNGIHFCALCDGEFYKNKTVAVIGGGNTALTEALELADICQRVDILQNLSTLTAEQSLIDEVNAKENIVIKCNRQIDRFEKVEDEVSECINIYITKTTDGSKYDLLYDGVFECVGMVPVTNLVDDKKNLSEQGYIKMAYGNFSNRLNTENCIFAAGDCRETAMKQVVTACADGAGAAKNIIDYIRVHKENS